VRRAKEAGALREDFVPEDLIILLMASAGVVAATGKLAQDRRPVSLAISFRRSRHRVEGSYPAPFLGSDVQGRAAIGRLALNNIGRSQDELFLRRIYCDS